MIILKHIVMCEIIFSLFAKISKHFEGLLAVLKTLSCFETCSLKERFFEFTDLRKDGNYGGF